ncbi:MAG: hypothetical protein Q4D58_03945 [Synergistaceae bacterium]|nr:hypothetical protein [Synergistaceae bacterium]
MTKEENAAVFAKSSSGDINSLEDRIWGCVNLVSLEEHCYSSWMRTNDESWLIQMEKYRSARQEVMSDILGEGVRSNKAELWCMFKHNCAAAMRYWESGNRFLKDEADRAMRYFDYSRLCVECLLAITAICRGEAKAEEQNRPPLSDEAFWNDRKPEWNSPKTEEQQTSQEVQEAEEQVEPAGNDAQKAQEVPEASEAPAAPALPAGPDRPAGQDRPAAPGEETDKRNWLTEAAAKLKETLRCCF